jgi:DNA-binding IclR family transcriptional regulator
MAEPRRIGAIEVGFRLVRVLEAADGPMMLRDLSERAGMPASKAHAYVASFVHEGLLAQDPLTGQYGLGPFALSLGVAALRQSDLVELVRRAAVDLSDATTCSVILSMWANRGPTIVHRFDGKRRGPTSIRVGYVVPVWRSATGRVFLAYLPERETDPYLLAEEGPSFPRAEAADECARIRRAGYALANDDSDLSGIAAPILDHDGHIVAALTLSRPFEGNTRERRRHLGLILRDAAGTISEQLGFVHPGAPEPRPVKGAAHLTGKKVALNEI